MADAVRADRRLLLVHAHPDDETITTGATMARYAASGAQVTLVTCTRGERGEVIPADLAHLEGSPDLGPHRVEELAAAMRALGVTDHRFLDDGTHLFRDSGMAWGPGGVAVAAPDTGADAFALAPLDVAAARLADVLRAERPQVVVTYEPGGGYGHPDHVRAHDVTMRAVALAASGPGGWVVPKVYWVVVPESLIRAALRTMADAGVSSLDPDGPLPSMAVPDELVTTTIDATSFQPAKAAALRAHATQVTVTDDDAFMALSNGQAQPVVGLEFFRLVRGEPAGPFDDAGRETDLFAGL